MAHGNPMTLQELRGSIWDQIPPSVRFTEADAAVIAQHRPFLASLGEPLVAMFYDTLFGHEPTRAIFQEGERPAREHTLRHWWTRTIEGPIDESFWDWMTFVGLVHVQRRVSNPMMIGIWGGIAVFVGDNAAQALDAAQALRLQQAFIRFGQMLTSIVAESYLRSYIKAVADSTGTSAVLLDNLVRGEVDVMLTEARKQLKA